MLIAALESRARVFEQSATIMAGVTGFGTEIAERDRRSAAACREIIARLDRLGQLMRRCRS